MNMEIVEGQTKRPGIIIDLKEGRIEVFSISEAKLKLFRDGGTFIGRINDWSITLFTCGISFSIAWLTTNIVYAKYILATLTLVSFLGSVTLFIMRKNKKSELFNLYDEVVSGKI